MNRFCELQRAFASGAIDRNEYIDRLNALHGVLSEYAQWLESSELAAIEITAGQVVAVSRDGLKFVLDLRDRRSPPLEALNFGSYEARDARLFFSSLGPGQTVLDVGAHVGWYALHAAGLYPNSRVHAFEPVPSSFAQLERHIGLNDLDNVAAQPFALGEREGPATFFVDPTYPTAASAVNILGSAGAVPIEVAVRRLDDLGLQPDVIKIDVEGGELGVLRGGRETLSRCRPAVFCEMLRKWSAKFGHHPDDMIRFMTELDYVCVANAVSIEGELRRIRTISEEEPATNFLFLHRERHAERLAGVA